MNLKQAIEILEQWVERDRRIRKAWGEDLEDDYNMFCEEKNVAIETVINAVNQWNMMSKYS
jgi:hypothetical protein